ncbi:MAG: hypothetical protein RLZZ175_2924 [Bacteroidota bacterium]|jgi:UMF1 family MFS transporter
MEKNNPKIVKAWCLYDWANSAYSLVIISTLFPIYYTLIVKDIAGESGIINFFGWEVKGSALFSFAISFSYLIAAFLSPLLSGIADYTQSKKKFMQFFCTLGSIACSLLFFLTKDTINLSLILFVVANIGFSGSIVFYNSYLSDLVTSDQMDKVSARGFSMGYIGSVILLVLNIVLITFAKTLFSFSPEPSYFAIRISFLSVGIWWFGFAQYTFAYLPKPTEIKEKVEGWFFAGLHELSLVAKQMWQMPVMKVFLCSFFFYSMGVQTVMYVAAIFGEHEIKVPSNQLQVIILMLQLIAIVGAAIFAKVSDKKGNFYALLMLISIWIVICVGAYFVSGGRDFWILAAFVGLVMGGIQSISRSTFAKLIPKESPDSASFFSFYDVMEKLSIVLGTLSYGLIDYITHSMRLSTVALGIYFIIGFVILFSLRKNRI